MIEMIQNVYLTVLETGGPLLTTILAVGLLIVLIQVAGALFGFVLGLIPKLLVIGVALWFLFPWIQHALSIFTNDLLVYEWSDFLKFTHTNPLK